MSSQHPFIKKLNERNLCTWYILPLIELNVASFGNSNFINSFIVTGEYQICVQVADMQLCLHNLDSYYFHGVLMRDHKDYLIFNIPAEWHDDYRLFVEGKFTKMSDLAKEIIKEGSGLKYDFPEDDEIITDSILMALDRHPSLLKKWSEILNVPDERNFPENLLSAPDEKSFINLT